MKNFIARILVIFAGFSVASAFVAAGIGIVQHQSSAAVELALVCWFLAVIVLRQTFVIAKSC